MSLLDRLKGGREPERGIATIDDYIVAMNSFTFGGIGYGYGGQPGIQQTLAGRATEMAPNNYVGLASHAYQANGVVFACMMVRQLLFSSIRFQWQNLRDGKQSRTFGTQALEILERPWVGGTTQDLLAQMIQHADLGGNAYVARVDGELILMRPDWVDIVVEERTVRGGRGVLGGGQLGWRKVGYLHYEDGDRGGDPVAFLADEVAHFCPIPDPLATYRGMSWLTPVLREIQADHAMTTHKRKFFDNAATVNMVVKHSPMADPEAVKKWADEMQSKHGGVNNAWKNLNLYPGADATPVGSNLKDIDFRNVQGSGETRIAAASGIAPVIVGLSEGLAASTYSNYGQARRRVADGTAHPLWQNLAGSMERICPPPDRNARLWYDASDVPFLREDEKDAAEIAQIKASTINTYITAGYTAESTVTAVEAGDLGLLQHSGLTSVQLLPPGTSAAAPTGQQTNGGSG